MQDYRVTYDVSASSLEEAVRLVRLSTKAHVKVLGEKGVKVVEVPLDSHSDERERRKRDES